MKIFNFLLRGAILIFLILVALFSLCYGFLYNTKINIITIIGLFVLLVLAVVFRKKLVTIKIYPLIGKLNIKKILIFAFIIRLLWIILIPTKPFSDFGIMYSYAKDAAAGKYYGFYGISYFARFAHDSITVLYFSLFYHITGNPLIIIKIFNVMFQTAAVYFIYKLVLELFKDEKKADFSALLLAIFPPFVMFVSQTASENMAMPFYIACVYYFFKALNSKDSKNIYYFILCGLTLSAANMLRMVGMVLLAAFAVYLLFYEGYKKFLTKYPVILISFFMLFFIVSQSLVSAGVLENQLWNSKEPAITSILKGTNIEHHGAYNDEDAMLPIKLNFDSGAIKIEAEKIIKERLTTTPPLKLAGFYVSKLTLQWGCGDYGAVNWTVLSEDQSFFANLIKQNMLIINILISLFYIFLLIRAILPIIKKEEIPKELYFFYILLMGFILLYLLTEMQPRYAFIAAWMFVILGIRNTKTNLL